jgi:2-keto-4-pentenoate hydratase/2-oxohepta-3-ene-1,7-dioic acid hydratase in catechol pathway
MLGQLRTDWGSKLHLKTIVDGELRQDEGVSDLLFGCAYLISYLSSGTTLQKGSIIMTGTPGGTVGLHTNCG